MNVIKELIKTKNEYIDRIYKTINVTKKETLINLQNSLTKWKNKLINILLNDNKLPKKENQT